MHAAARVCRRKRAWSMMRERRCHRDGRERSACGARLAVLGFDALDEDEFAALSLQAANAEEAIALYRKELCYGHGKPCAAAA
jgi:hypothetical protein